MIKRTRTGSLNARVTVNTLKICSYMSVMGTRARGIIVTSGTTQTISVAPTAVTGRRTVTRTTTGTVTRGVTNRGHKDRLAACRVAVVKRVDLVNARTVCVTVSARVARRAIATVLRRIVYRNLVVHRVGTRRRGVTVTCVTRGTRRLESRRTVVSVTVDTHPTARLVRRTFFRRTVESVHLRRIVTHLADTETGRRISHVVVRARARTGERRDRTRTDRVNEHRGPTGLTVGIMTDTAFVTAVARAIGRPTIIVMHALRHTVARKTTELIKGRAVIVTAYSIKTVRITQCTADVTRRLVMTVNTR
jgi:hypothetical protein